MTHPSHPGGYAPGSTAAAPGPGSPNTPATGPNGASATNGAANSAGSDGFGETRLSRSPGPAQAQYSGGPQLAGPGAGTLTSAPPPASTPVAPAPPPPPAARTTTAVPAIPASAAPVPPAVAAAGASGRGKTARVRGPRRARLQLRHINPFTVLKFSAVLAVALFFVWLITIGLLYEILNAAGVVKDINDSIVKINGPGSSAPVTAGRVFAGATIIGLINIVLFIALSTVGSVVYNLCADLAGGVEVTLSERES